MTVDEFQASPLRRTYDGVWEGKRLATEYQPPPPIPIIEGDASNDSLYSLRGSNVLNKSGIRKKPTEVICIPIPSNLVRFLSESGSMATPGRRTLVRHQVENKPEKALVAADVYSYEILQQPSVPPLQTGGCMIYLRKIPIRSSPAHMWHDHQLKKNADWLNSLGYQLEKQASEKQDKKSADELSTSSDVSQLQLPPSVAKGARTLASMAVLPTSPPSHASPISNNHSSSLPQVATTPLDTSQTEEASKVSLNVASDDIPQVPL